MPHLKYEILVEYLENRLPQAQRAEVDSHLAGPCPVCERRRRRLASALRAARQDRTMAPPPAVLAQAVAVAREGRPHSRPSPWLRVVAALRFDSRLTLSAAATRGASRARQLLFTTEQVDIDLQLRSGPGEHDLLGQILGTHDSDEILPAFVSLQAVTGRLYMATETNSLGQFAFRQIPSGTYDLLFDLENQEVAITGLEFQNDPR